MAMQARSVFRRIPSGVIAAATTPPPPPAQRLLLRSPLLPTPSVRLAHSIPRPRPQPNSSSSTGPSSSSPSRSASSSGHGTQSTTATSSSTTSNEPPSRPAAAAAATSSSPAEGGGSSEIPATTTKTGPAPPPRPKRPSYQLDFTCTPCGTRSSHVVSKQAYHHGSALVTCPGCQAKHVVSDHLGIFTDRKGVTAEQLVREKGGIVRKGTLGPDGDIEFWPDDRAAATEGTATTTTTEEAAGAAGEGGTAADAVEGEDGSKPSAVKNS